MCHWSTIFHAWSTTQHASGWEEGVGCRKLWEVVGWEEGIGGCVVGGGYRRLCGGRRV